MISEQLTEIWPPALVARADPIRDNNRCDTDPEYQLGQRRKSNSKFKISRLFNTQKTSSTWRFTACRIYPTSRLLQYKNKTAQKLYKLAVRQLRWPTGKPWKHWYRPIKSRTFSNKRNWFWDRRLDFAIRFREASFCHRRLHRSNRLSSPANRAGC